MSCRLEKKAFIKSRLEFHNYPCFFSLFMIFPMHKYIYALIYDTMSHIRKKRSLIPW